MELSLQNESFFRQGLRWLTRGLFLHFALVVGTLVSFGNTAPEAFFTDPDTAEITVPEGHLVLRWDARQPSPLQPVEFELEQSMESPGSRQRTAYQGSDTGTFVSGLPKTGASFRIRARTTDDAEWGPWSDPLHVHVNYPSRQRVALLGLIGAGMFVVLLSAIVIGSRRNRPNTPPTA